MADQHQRQLNTWKEIAAHFGKSTRTVQRWEATMGLPVKRIKTPSGEILYAFPHELDAWRDGLTGDSTVGGREFEQDDAAGDAETDSDRDNQAESPDEANDPIAPNEPPRGTPQKAERLPASSEGEPVGWPHAARRSLVLSACAVLAVAAVIVAALWPWGESRQLMTAEVADNALVSKDAAGTVLWRHEFQQKLASVEPSSTAGSPRSRPGGPPVVTDLTGDGQPEVLLLATYGNPSENGQWDQELLCFSPGGKILWRYRPQLTLTFRDEQFSANWIFLDILVAQPPSAPTVWVSVTSSPWWGSALVRIGPDGRSEVRFISAGAVYTLGQIESQMGWRLLAGGVNNEYAAASLAVLADDAPPASSPQTAGGKHACRDCPSAGPDAYFLFPRTDINIAEGTLPYNRIWQFLPASDGADAQVFESQMYAATLFYRLNRSLDIVRLALSDSTAHRQLEIEGKLDHKEADCPVRTQGVTIRKWTAAAGWISRVLKPVQ